MSIVSEFLIVCYYSSTFFKFFFDLMGRGDLLISKKFLFETDFLPVGDLDNYFFGDFSLIDEMFPSFFGFFFTDFVA